MGEEVTYTFGGTPWAALRPDQKQRVQQIMASWRQVGRMWYDRDALRRAIRKVLNNYP